MPLRLPPDLCTLLEERISAGVKASPPALLTYCLAGCGLPFPWKPLVARQLEHRLH